MMVFSGWRAITLIIVASLGILFLAASAVSTPNEPRLTITDDGFEPRELTIRPGTTVIFLNKSSTDSWPASNPHPTHTEHPFFDPGHAFAPGSSWSLLFEEAGEFRYHDHVSESKHGVIRVRTPIISWLLDLVPRDCSALEGEEKTACMEDALRRTLGTKGLAAAFELFLQYYRTEPAFVEGSCHWHSHLLGEEAYRLYAAGEKVELIPEVSYCGYGFFHGFMARLASLAKLTSGLLCCVET